MSKYLQVVRDHLDLIQILAKNNAIKHSKNNNTMLARTISNFLIVSMTGKRTFRLLRTLKIGVMLKFSLVMIISRLKDSVMKNRTIQNHLLRSNKNIFSLKSKAKSKIYILQFKF